MVGKTSGMTCLSKMAWLWIRNPRPSRTHEMMLDNHGSFSAASRSWWSFTGNLVVGAKGDSSVSVPEMKKQKEKPCRAEV